MSLKRHVACWLALGLLLIAAASLPWWRLPAPQEALEIDRATCLSGCEGAEREELPLPQARSMRGGQTELRLAFDLARVPQQPLHLFIPMLSQSAVISLAGRQIADTGNRAPTLGLTSGATTLVPLPSDALVAGRNVLDITLSSSGVVRGYLSPVYVGAAQHLAPYYRLRLFLLEHVRLMAMAAQLLITLAVLVAWSYRPREALFGWTFLLLTVSLLAYVGLLPMHGLLPYAFILSTSAAAFILQILALLVNGTPVPRWLQACVVAVPGGLVLLALSGAAPIGAILLAAGVPLIIASTLTALGIAAWGALVKGVREAWLLVVPLLLLAIATLHDGALVAGWIDGPVFVGIYFRQALTLAIAVILARRLGLSLRQLDEANARLARRLAQREEELARLYEAERSKAAQRVRSEERQRLTADLHDGLSGHLASIIALAERVQAPAIERSAREALDDLRAVIHSLDIGDRELTVALSDFRDRIERQLKRMGIALHWSMARLPEISGVTPAHALNVLRILQEAVTNAVKHGPARRIAITGGRGEPGQAHVVIENDGAPFRHGGGLGLENMRRRAGQLGGSVHIEAITGGTRVELRLPDTLPEAAAGND